MEYLLFSSWVVFMIIMVGKIVVAHIELHKTMEHFDDRL